jgi:hypothetical protein
MSVPPRQVVAFSGPLVELAPGVTEDEVREKTGPALV